MSVLIQGPRRDGCHVAVIDGCRLGSTVRPPDDTVGANRGRPPNNAFDANIPGRMIVDSSPAAAMSRSISAWSTAIGFGCWQKACGAWCGDERKTTRRALVARRSTTAGAVVGGAVQTRKTALTPRSPALSDWGSVTLPVTN